MLQSLLSLAHLTVTPSGLTLLRVLTPPCFLLVSHPQQLIRPARDLHRVEGYVYPPRGCTRWRWQVDPAHTESAVKQLKSCPSVRGVWNASMAKKEEHAEHLFVIETKNFEALGQAKQLLAGKTVSMIERDLQSWWTWIPSRLPPWPTQSASFQVSCGLLRANWSAKNGCESRLSTPVRPVIGITHAW